MYVDPGFVGCGVGDALERRSSTPSKAKTCIARSPGSPSPTQRRSRSTSGSASTAWRTSANRVASSAGSGTWTGTSARSHVRAGRRARNGLVLVAIGRALGPAGLDCHSADSFCVSGNDGKQRRRGGRHEGLHRRSERCDRLSACPDARRERLRGRRDDPYTGEGDPLTSIGAEPVVADALDREAVLKAVVRAKPEAVVHQATALTGVFNLKHFARTFEQTNRLRTLGADNLVAAARAAGARRFVAQGFAGWPYTSGGSARGPRTTRSSPPRRWRWANHRRRAPAPGDRGAGGVDDSRGHRASLRRVLRTGDVARERWSDGRGRSETAAPDRRRRSR